MCTGEDSTHCSWYPKRGICSSRAKNREVLLLVTPRRALSISRPWALRKLGKCLGKGRIEKKRVPIWWLCICSLSMNNKYSTLYSIGVCMDSGTGVSLSQPSTSGWKGLNDLHCKLFKKNHIYCRYHERFPDSKKSFVPMRPANWIQLNRFWKCLLYYQGASCKGLHWSIILWYIFTNRQQLEIVKKCPRATFLQKPKVFRQINLKYLLKYCQV